MSEQDIRGNFLVLAGLVPRLRENPQSTTVRKERDEAVTLAWETILEIGAQFFVDVNRIAEALEHEAIAKERARSAKGPVDLSPL